MSRAKPVECEPVAWVDVSPGDQDSILYPGYTFFGIKKLPYGKHNLFTTPPLDAETRAMIVSLCNHIREHVHTWSLIGDAENILKKLGTE